ncbi:MAG: amidohydrolase family protein [Pseudomonadota bacterium]
MTIIDAWGQIPSRRMARSDWLAPLLRWTGMKVEEFDLTPAHTVAAMDSAGVDLMILAAWHGPEGSLISNDEVAAQLDAAPDRFRGLATANLAKPREAVCELRDRLADERFVGVRFLPWLWGLPPNDRRYYPIYSVCCDFDVPFCTQIGHTGPLRTSDTGRLIPYIEDVLLDFPELRVVGGHVGFPWIDELTSLTIKFPNLYVDTSAYALHRLPPSFLHYLAGAGRGRVMFGTNWPMLSPERCLASLDDLGLDDEHRAAFLGGIARKVFRLAI